MKEPFESQKDWRWTLHWKCWIFKVCFILVVLHVLLLSVWCLIWRMARASRISVINMECMNDRVSNWSKRSHGNRRNVGKEYISENTWSLPWDYIQHSFPFHFDAMCLVADVHSWERHGWSKVWYSWHGVVLVCVLDCREWRDWRRWSKAHSTWIGEEHITYEIGHLGCVSPPYCPLIVSSLVHVGGSLIQLLIDVWHYVVRACDRHVLRINFDMSMWSYRSSKLWYHSGAH